MFRSFLTATKKTTTGVTTTRRRLLHHHQQWKKQQQVMRTSLQRSIVAASSPSSVVVIRPTSTTHNAIAAMSTTTDSFQQQQPSFAATTAAAAAAAIVTTFLATTISMSSSTMTTERTTACDEAPADDSLSSSSTTTTTTPYSTPKPSWTPANVANDKFDDVVKHSETEIDNFPVYTSEQVAENDGSDGKPIWMSYGGVVYDVTDFIHNHPGGSEKILMAAGSSIEPFWHTYRQHFASDLPTRLMEHMVIGRLLESDQEKIDDQMEVIYETSEDPFEHEPVRHKALRVHSQESMNAETPADLLTQSYLTPNSLFYIRHHHPVPFLTSEQIQDYTLTIDLSKYTKRATQRKKIIKLSLEDLKKMPKTDVIATLQCSGNRRSGFNKYQRTSGTGWGQGALSTAKWSGVLLSHVLAESGLDDALSAENHDKLEHVVFHALDGMSASVSIEKAMNPYGDCLIAYEMNDEILPRDHGYPLRVIVPGYAGIRNVKWVNRIELSTEEAEGAWQRGLNYKILPPGVTDASTVNMDEMPGLMEASVFSGITKIEPLSSLRRISTHGSATNFKSNAQPGDRVMMRVTGWAWAGGGRNIVRVDLTGDESRHWTSAKITEGDSQKYNRAWAWVFWEADVPALVKEDLSVEIACKAIDSAFNVQPESCDHIWNIRGLGNNSWFRMTYRLA